jgi:phosphate transport system permease protein
VAAAAGGFVGPFVGIPAMPAVVLTVTTLVPFGLYAALVSRDPAGAREATTGQSATAGVRDEGVAADRYGLLLPLVLVAGALLFVVLVDALGVAGPNSNVTWELLTSTTVTDPQSAGVYPGIVGSLLLMLIVAFAAFPVGVGAAVYLEEYAPDNRFTRIVQVNISNLAGVPSVVYGLLGLGLFIRYLGSPPGTVVVGGLTLALLILPIVIIAAQEAIRSVPDSLRQASYGMGATRWQTVRNVVLPRSFAGILTGTILALGRAIGETAPLLVIGAPNVFDVPDALSARVGALPLQIYVWATTFALDEFYNQVIPAAVIVLLVILLAMNSLAIVLRNKYQSEG